MTATHDPDAGIDPAYKAPPHACDAHFHVFGPPGRYAYGTDIRYTPPHQPWETYLPVAQRLGFTRFVFVQPSAYGFNNDCMLDVMRAIDPAIRRGIIDLDETATSERALAELDALGVRGIRVNVSPVRKPEAGLARSMLPRIGRLAALARELNWHLDFLAPGWLVSELMPTLRELPVQFTVAHFGLFPARDGAQQAGFREFLALAGDGSKRCYVKLTGVYRFSTAPGFADVAPFARALMERVPDQLIWGSDFPHLSFHDKVGTIQLYNLLGTWADAGLRQRILADNPARLFGFA